MLCYLLYEVVEGVTKGTSGGECYGTYSSGTASGGGYSNACIHSGSNTYSGGNTGWYNYAAASAGTITDTSNTVISTESICPKGWSLPTVAQTRIIGPDDGSTTYTTNFSPVQGGYYNDGTLDNESTRGGWWGSTASTTYNGARRYYLRYDDSSLYTGYGYRYNGLYIRCVSEEKDVSDLTYMQDMTPSVAVRTDGK